MGIMNKLKNTLQNRGNTGQSSSNTQPTSETRQVTTSTPPVKSKEPKMRYSDYPQMVDNMSLAYHYTNIKIKPSPEAETIEKMADSYRKFELTIEKREEKYICFYKGKEFGEILDKIDMLNDWYAKNDIVKCWLSVGTEMVALGFYRDEQKQFAHCEQEIVRLTGYRGHQIQANLGLIKPGERLELSTEQDEKVDKYGDYTVSDEYVLVWSSGGRYEIGKLPKKCATRYLEEGCSGVFFDHLEDDYEHNTVPYVKFYW